MEPESEDQTHRNGPGHRGAPRTPSLGPQTEQKPGGSIDPARLVAIELRHLRYFLLVAEELHFGRAALRAGIDQSPLSRQILDLENRLGVRLFHRTRRRTALTPIGEKLATDVTRILADIQTSVAAARSMESGLGVPFRFGLAEGAAGPAFARLLAACENRTPPINVVVVERSAGELFDLMRSGGLDGAITLHPAADADLTSTCIWHHAMVIAAPRGHWTEHRTAVSLTDLAHEPWVLPDRDVLPGYAAQQEEILRANRVSPSRVTRAGHQNSIGQMIAAGRGVGLIPADIAGSAIGLEITPVADNGAYVASWFAAPLTASPLLTGVLEEIGDIARDGGPGVHCHCDRP